MRNSWGVRGGRAGSGSVSGSGSGFVASGTGTGPGSLHGLSSAGSGGLAVLVACSGAAGLGLDIMSSGIFATGKY
jgi:hypothetical protein